MSMLTAQADRLREVAGVLRENYTFVGFGGVVNRDSTIYNAASQMEEAADTIENLRNRLTETCHMVLRYDYRVYGEAPDIWWECDGCGCTLPNPLDMPEIHYCPSCGRRVV